jgi:Family of unknown function (DUF5367)
MRRVVIVGIAFWLVGTLGLRLAGQYILQPQNLISTVLLLVLSFLLMALVARRVCTDARIPPEKWPTASVALVAPSMILDTFSAAFFPLVYPNIPAQAAGLFGGWILSCCAGALLGVNFQREFLKKSNEQRSIPLSARKGV